MHPERLAPGVDGRVEGGLDGITDAGPVTLRAGRSLRAGRLPISARLGLALVLALCLVALAAPIIAPQDPAAQDIAGRLLGPRAANPLGTDHLGRDILSRLIWGARLAMGLAIPGVLGALLLGSLAGIAAAYGPAWLRRPILVGIDGLQALPPILLALMVLALTGPSLLVLVAVVALALTPGYARVMRVQVQGLLQAPFVEAARSLGAGRLRIALRHILPNALYPLLVLAAMDLPGAVTLEAGLSFLGLGVQPPTPSWGTMLAEGFSRLRESPWPLIGPAGALMLATLGFTLLGEGLAEKSKGR
jgi:peptide/nickel transport system permease protein